MAAVSLNVVDLRLATGQRVNLEVRGGEIHCIDGPSGIGKSRLLRALADLDGCAGSLQLDGIDRNAMSAAQWRRRVMLVPAVSQWWLSSVMDHLSTDVRALVDQLGLRIERLQAPVAELSTGERARSALLRALASAPEVLMLDEPTAALDAVSRLQVEGVVRNYAREHAVIWVTHDPDQMQRVATHRWTMSAAALTANSG